MATSADWWRKRCYPDGAAPSMGRRSRLKGIGEWRRIYINEPTEESSPFASLRATARARLPIDTQTNPPRVRMVIKVRKQTHYHQQRCGSLPRTVAFAAPSPACHDGRAAESDHRANRPLPRKNVGEEAFQKCENKPIRRAGERIA